MIRDDAGALADASAKAPRRGILVEAAAVASAVMLAAVMALFLLPRLDFMSAGMSGFLVGLRQWAIVVLVVLVILLGLAIWRDVRVPPPAYKALNELDEWLSSAGLACDWSRVSRDRRVGCLVVSFGVRGSKANIRDFRRQLEHGSQVFRGAQMVKVDERVVRGRRDGFELRLWYRALGDVYERASRRNE